MATLIMSNKRDVGSKDQSKPYSYSPSYLRSITKNQSISKHIEIDNSSPWVDSYHNPLDTLQEVSENSSTQPEDSPRIQTALTKSKTYLDTKAKLFHVAKSRRKTFDTFTHQLRHRRFKLVVQKLLVCIRWTKLYLKSSKNSIQEAKRLYTEMHERRSDYEPIDLMFDKSSYKAKTAVKISKETRRILLKPPAERTDEEVFRAQVALGNIKDIAQYPFRMQREIAKFGEYESFGGRRIILRQGHPPSASYFVLSGEMFEIIYESSQAKPQLGQTIVKGEEFGEKAIVEDTWRECTVITKEPTELLSLKKKHFRRIFMLGGGLCILDSEQKKFLRHLPYMKEFPIDKLEENSEKVKAQYFKKGAMITEDTKYFPWLILVKTGSVFIYKKLKRVLPLQGKSTEQTKTVEKEKQENREMTRRQMLSDIRIPVRQNDEETRGSKKFIHPKFDKNDTVSEYLPPIIEKQHSTKQTKYSFHSIQDQLLKRTTPPHFEPSKSPLSTESNCSWLTSLESTTNKIQSQDGFKSVSEKDDNHINTHQNNWQRAKYKAEEKLEEEATTEIVQVNTITNGQIFGLDDIMIDKRVEQRQSFSVFSGGADVIFIDKYFFKENMTERFRSQLVKFFCPYPSDEELQEQLQTHVDWNAYKERTLSKTLVLLDKETDLRKSQSLY